ncbi:MAG: hypothetical protein Q8Q60_04850 [Candidatus Chromulinivorax sp.]|nr:hypothetical protein [Candidatus Chromulinivorax sp.]
MKRILTIFACLMTFLVGAKSHDLYRIEKMVQPYEDAMAFITNVDSTKQVQDHDVYVFFNNNDLYEKKDVNKFNRVLRSVKKLTYAKKSLRDHRDRLELLIDSLEKVQKFIADHASTHYALIKYYEIAASYYYIDEQHSAVTDIIIQQSAKLGLQDMQRGRGLYKFVKKINRDIHSLAVLFYQNNLSDELMIKMNQLKTKLVTLKSKMVTHQLYASQLSTTRWLKAFGSIVVYSLMIIPIALIPSLSVGDAILIGFLDGLIVDVIIKQ